MKMDGVKGNVTAKGHENWIELKSINWGVNRDINALTGQINRRSVGIPQFSEIVIHKNIDQASPLLFAKACKGEVKGDIVIHVCHTGDSPKMYLEYTLSQGLLTHLEHVGTASSQHDQMMETMSIHYGAFKMRYVPRNAQNQDQSPISAGYDIAKAEVA